MNVILILILILSIHFSHSLPHLPYGRTYSSSSHWAALRCVLPFGAFWLGWAEEQGKAAPQGGAFTPRT